MAAKTTYTKLPSNAEAERTVLGAVMIDDVSAAEILSSLTIDDFTDERNRLIFSAMKELVNHNKPIDPTTVTDELLNLHSYDDAGGADYMLLLIKSPINFNNIDYYVSLLKNQSVLRAFLLGMEALQNDYRDGKIKDIGEYLSMGIDSLSNIASRRSVAGFKTASEVTEEVRIKIQQESRRSNRGITGVDTGYKRLNQLSHGWQKGNLIILAARPSVGKTALALNFALKATESTHAPVAFFSGEMSNDLIMKRILSAKSRVPVSDLMTGQLDARSQNKVDNALREIARTKLFFDDSPNPKLGDIIAKSHKLKKSNPDLALIIVDYINIIQTEGKFDSRALQIGAITGQLKQLARTLEVPVIALSQLNRATDDNEFGNPNLSNLKESSSIEQDADIVMMLYRPDYYHNQGRKKEGNAPGGEFGQKMQEQIDEQNKIGQNKDSISMTIINVAKNRNGQTGQVMLLFTKTYQLFDNPSLSSEREFASKHKDSYVPIDDDEEE